MIPRAAGPLLAGNIRSRSIWSGQVQVNRNAQGRLSNTNQYLPREHLKASIERHTPLQHALDRRAAYHTLFVQNRHAWRAEDRAQKLDTLCGGQFESTRRPIIAPVKRKLLRGAPGFQCTDHVDASSPMFLQARKQIKKTQERLREDVAVAQVLCSACEPVSVSSCCCLLYCLAVRGTDDNEVRQRLIYSTYYSPR